jgi:hypothetical protein
MLQAVSPVPDMPRDDDDEAWRLRRGPAPGGITSAHPQQQVSWYPARRCAIRLSLRGAWDRGSNR